MVFTCRGVLLDLDGVLVDSTPAVARVWRRWAVERGLEPEAVIETAHGRRSIETIRTFAPELEAERENVRVEKMEIEEKDGVVALPGGAELLRSLPGDRVAVVTSATRALAEARLGYAGLPCPERIVSADDVAQGKPSPEPYLKGAALLGIAPRDCLAFEDAPSGIRAAQAAGMVVIAVETTFPRSALQTASAIVNSLKQVEVVQDGEAIGIAVTGIAMR